MKTIRITLIKSPCGHKKNQIKTVKALGLHKIGQTVEKTASPQILGMARTVAHLVEVQDA